MNGYVINTASMWMHAMKRAVAPGAQIPLDELYDQYGKKHELKKGKEFIEWLRNVKLRGNDNWDIVIEGKEVKNDKKEDKKYQADNIMERRLDISKIDPKKMDISEVVSLSVRQAREVVPKIVDVKLLKYSLKEATPRSGKDSLCRILKKRITELEIQRR